MTLRIASTRRSSAVEWDSVWEACDYATYFHSREWAETWSEFTGGGCRPEPERVAFSDGKVALLPLSSQRSSPWGRKSCLSSPGGTFGGWISTDGLEVSHAVLLGEHLVRCHSDLTWRFNPYDATVFRSGVRPDVEEDTRALELTAGFDVVRKGYTKEAARAAAKALRHGVMVRVAAGVEDWRAYYRVYEDSLRRWGERASSRYGWELFDSLQRRGSPRVRLWLALHSGEIVAGALCFYAKRHVVYWHGAALSASFPMRPVNLLMSEAIQDACGRGYAWFDFNPSGGHEGVEAFKKSFGARPLPCPVVRRAAVSTPSVLERILSSLRRCSIL